MNKIKLDKQEQALLDSVESGEYKSILTDSRRKELAAIAANTLKKAKQDSSIGSE